LVSLSESYLKVFPALLGGKERYTTIYGHGRQPITRTNSNGNTPFHIAVSVAYLPNIIALLDLNPGKNDMDIRNKKGQTPLDIAIAASYPEKDIYQSMFSAGLLIGHNAYHYDFVFLRSKKVKKIGRVITV